MFHWGLPPHKYLQVPLVEVGDCLLACVRGSHAVAPPHYAVKTFEAFRGERPKWPRLLPHFLEVGEGVEVYRGFLRGFPAKASLEGVVEEPVQGLEIPARPRQVVLHLLQDVVLVVV